MKQPLLFALLVACSSNQPPEAAAQPPPATAAQAKPSACRIQGPYHLHVRTLSLELAGDAWAQSLVAGATKQPGTAPPRERTIFEILGTSPGALRGQPDAIRGVFAAQLGKTPGVAFKATYRETWLAWDEHDELTLRTVAITPTIKAPWAMQDPRMESTANGLDTYLWPHAPIAVDVTVERAHRTFLEPDQLKRCGGVFACQKAARGTRSHYGFNVQYGLDWSKREKIEASSYFQRGDSKLGFGYADAIASRRVVFDHTDLAPGLPLYFTLEAQPPDGRAQLRNRIQQVCSGDRCFSPDQCMVTFQGAVTDVPQGKIHLDSVGYTEVIELSNDAFPPAVFQLAAPGNDGPLDDASRIAAFIPDVDAIYARFRSVVGSVPAAGANLRDTLYGTRGAPTPGGDPHPQDICTRSWPGAGMRSVCTLFGHPNATKFASTFTVADLRDADPIIDGMFSGKDAAFYKKTFTALGSEHWHFVFALERARREIVALLGKGNALRNVKDNLTEKLAWTGLECKHTKCVEREVTVADKVARDADRGQWKRVSMVARMEATTDSQIRRVFTFDFEHTAGCYAHDDVEIAVDAFHDTVSTGAQWWRDNDPKAFAAIGKRCGNAYCGPCVCLYQAYRVVRALGDATPVDAPKAMAGLCPDSGADFAAADKRWGAAMRQEFGYR